ncbi:hypothetical protein [Rickettsia rhipicephali]|nr:hypothetical protein [Rickettsia rhipicephali]
MSFLTKSGVARMTRLCHSRESGNPLKSIKKLVFIGLYQGRPNY